MLSAHAIEISPRLARGYSALGHALYQRAATHGFLGGSAVRAQPGSYHARALDVLATAATLDPHDKDSRFRLGTLLAKDKKRTKEAMHQLQAAPHSPAPRVARPCPRGSRRPAV